MKTDENSMFRGPVTHSYRSCNRTCLTCGADRWERLPTYASPARQKGERPMRLRQWLASGCVIALAAGLTACGGSSGGSSGGGGSSTTAASSSLVVETAFV